MSRVLFVCTGNVCRSPIAELLLRRHWGPDSGVNVSSAGLQALVGNEIHTPIQRILTDARVPHRGFTATQVTDEMLSDADLIMAMTQEQRSAIVRHAPRTVRRCFTLREFARTAVNTALEADHRTVADRLVELVPTAARSRGMQRVRLGEDDLADPFRRGDLACLRAFDAIEQAVDDIVRAVGGVGGAERKIENGGPGSIDRSDNVRGVTTASEHTG